MEHAVQIDLQLLLEAARWQESGVVIIRREAPNADLDRVGDNLRVRPRWRMVREHDPTGGVDPAMQRPRWRRSTRVRRCPGATGVIAVRQAAAMNGIHRPIRRSCRYWARFRPNEADRCQWHGCQQFPLETGSPQR